MVSVLALWALSPRTTKVMLRGGCTAWWGSLLPQRSPECDPGKFSKDCFQNPAFCLLVPWMSARKVASVLCKTIMRNTKTWCCIDASLPYGAQPGTYPGCPRPLGSSPTSR